MKPENTEAVMLFGKSKRLKNKPFIKIEGKELFLYGLNTLKEVFDSILLVCNADLKKKLFEYDLNFDIISEDHNIGPVGGIYEGMKNLSSEYVFVTGCDMPFLNPGVIKFLYQRVEKDGIVVKREEGTEKMEPLHAFYRREKILEVFDSQRSIRDMIVMMDVKFILDKELKKYDPQLITFTNVNYPSDLNLMKKNLSRNGPNHYFPDI